MKPRKLSVFVDLQGLTDLRRKFIGVLNDLAPSVAADLAEAVFSFYQEHVRSLEPDRPVVTADRLKWFPLFQKMLHEWADRNHVTHKGDTPEWVAECARHTLKWWRANGVDDQLVAPDRIYADVDWVAELNSITATAARRGVQRLKAEAKKVVSGALTEEKFGRLIGHIHGEEFRQELQRFYAELFESAEAKQFDELMAAAGIATTAKTETDVRLGFSDEQLAWAVQYQVLGEPFDDMTGVEQDGSVPRRTVKKVLGALGISPRRRRGRPRGTTKKMGRKSL